MEISCTKCGSHDLHAGKKGFSGKKAVAGAVLTGGVGLLAGTIGSNNVLITCLACGHTFRPGDQLKQALPKKEPSRAAYVAVKYVIGACGFIFMLIAIALASTGEYWTPFTVFALLSLFCLLLSWANHKKLKTMKKAGKAAIILGLTLASCISHGQSIRIITDSGGKKGLLVYNRIYDRKNIEWAEARHIIDSINAVSPGWRLPTRKEMEAVFNITYDKRRLASSLTPSDCITADYNIDGISKDTVHYVGIMRGRKFQSGLPLQEKPCRFFLVKDF